MLLFALVLQIQDVAATPPRTPAPSSFLRLLSFVTASPILGNIHLSSMRVPYTCVVYMYTTSRLPQCALLVAYYYIPETDSHIIVDGRFWK